MFYMLKTLRLSGQKKLLHSLCDDTDWPVIYLSQVFSGKRKPQASWMSLHLLVQIVLRSEKPWDDENGVSFLGNVTPAQLQSSFQ